MALFVDKLAIRTDSFPALGRIPDQFSADGGNELPSLTIDGAPEGTVEFAVIVNDPDAPLPHGFTHAVIFGIPADSTTVDVSAPGVRFGSNGGGAQAWWGPQPPFGHGDHHYYFWVYALSEPVEGDLTREEFFDAYGDAIIEQARVVGTFSR